jgi:hypothetical protein
MLVFQASVNIPWQGDMFRLHGVESSFGTMHCVTMMECSDTFLAKSYTEGRAFDSGKKTPVALPETYATFP